MSEADARELIQSIALFLIAVWVWFIDRERR